MKHNKNKKNVEVETIVPENPVPVLKALDLDDIKNYQKNLMKDYAVSVAKSMIPKIAENGFVVENGHIVEVGDSSYSGFIPALALNIDSDSGEVETIPTAVTCSINQGFRYVAPDMENDYPYDTFDNGPVAMPTIIGSAERPYALLVPLGSPEAIRDSADLLDARYKSMIQEDYDELESGCGCHDICCKKNNNHKW